MRRLASITVFGLTSCAFYIVSTAESMPALLEPGRWEFLAGDEALGSKEVLAIGTFLVVAHTLFALKLYAQAWGIDQSAVLLELAESANTWREKSELVAEWILRSVWVGLVSYLPNAFARTVGGEDLIFGITLGDYYLGLILTVVVWDLMMFGKVRAARSPVSYVKRSGRTRRQVGRELFWSWVVIDCILLLVAFVARGVEGRYVDQSSLAALLVGGPLLGITVPLCAFQLVFWGREVVRSKLVLNGG